MEGGPEDMTIYGLTKENRMDDQIRRFFQCVREELQMIDGIELFQEDKERFWSLGKIYN